MGRGDFFNREGYADPTAYHATRLADAEDALQGRVSSLIKDLKSTIRESGFELLNRIELKDRRSGREFR